MLVQVCHRALPFITEATSWQRDRETGGLPDSVRWTDEQMKVRWSLDLTGPILRGRGEGGLEVALETKALL